MRSKAYIARLVSEGRLDWRDYWGATVPAKVQKLVTDPDYGVEVCPEHFSDGEFVVYVPEGGDAGDIRWARLVKVSPFDF